MKQRGFTLLELLFVLVIVALLASLAAPMLSGSIGQARESALKQDLRVMRQALDDYHADQGKYPSELNELVEKRYLRALPVEPITQRQDGWTAVRNEGEHGGAGVTDVRSGSEERARDGSHYRDW